MSGSADACGRKKGQTGKQTKRKDKEENRLFSRLCEDD